jgi:hypothetical protein
LDSYDTEEAEHMSLYTAAGKAKAARGRTGHHAGVSGSAGGQISSGRPDITDEQKQEIREAFELFVRTPSSAASPWQLCMHLTRPIYLLIDQRVFQ